MVENCPYCGTSLLQTNTGKYICPNHGIIYINRESEEDNDEKTNYIG